MGAEDSTATITLKKGNIGSNTLVPEQIELENVADTFSVPVRRLGDYLAQHHIEQPVLIKIDLEGFEYQVIPGMADYFGSAIYRPPIVCEVNEDAGEALGYTLQEIADYMAGLGYSAFRLADTQTPIGLADIHGFPNILFRPS